MTTQTGDGAAAAQSFVRDWQAVRDDGDIQFAPLDAPVPPETPEWLRQLGEFLAGIFRPIGQLFGQVGVPGRWILIGLAIVLVLALLWRLREPIALWLGRPPRATAVSEWQPDSVAALALLEDADRLAAEGRYDEATHLLLKRSVGQIAEARPGLLEPSSTAREIAALPALPEAARRAFAVIAERVERSLFALRRLSAEDWQAARTAYADFALATPALPAA